MLRLISAGIAPKAQLKKAGRVATPNDDEGHDRLSFTDLGLDYAAGHGVEVKERQPSGKATGITAKDADALKGKKVPEIETVTQVGPCKRVHQVADAMKGKTRKESVDACEAEGINRGTARMQTGRWTEVNGWTWPEPVADA